MLWSIGSAWTQAPAEDTQGDILIQCGADKVAIFADTTSKDGRFALAWTLRPNRKHDPVDWSLYRREDLGPFWEKHATEDQDWNMTNGDYLVVDGVVDLKAKKFTDLFSQQPYRPNKNHGHLAVDWSDAQGGTRYAVISNDLRFSTEDLWLVVLTARGVRVVELTSQAYKAAVAYIRKRDPKDYKNYGATYEIGKAAADGEPSQTVFNKDSVSIRFVQEVPKSDTDVDYGKMIFSLPQGNVVRTVPAKR